MNKQEEEKEVQQNVLTCLSNRQLNAGIRDQLQQVHTKPRLLGELQQTECEDIFNEKAIPSHRLNMSLQ